MTTFEIPTLNTGRLRLRNLAKTVDRRPQDGAELAVRLASPPLRDRWFADSPLERDGFETSVPGERAYGLNLCLSPYELPFSARSCWACRGTR